MSNMVSFDDQSIWLILFTAVILWLLYLCRIFFGPKAQDPDVISEEVSSSTTAESTDDTNA